MDSCPCILVHGKVSRPPRDFGCPPEDPQTLVVQSLETRFSFDHVPGEVTRLERFPRQVYGGTRQFKEGT